MRGVRTSVLVALALLSGCLSLDDYPRVHPLEPENAALDYDGDGVANGEDNCPSDENPSQADANGDRVGDVCAACGTAARTG